MEILKPKDKLLLHGKEVSILKKLGQGQYGFVFLINVETIEDNLVLKITKPGGLNSEYEAFEILNGARGVPNYYGSGSLIVSDDKQFKFESTDGDGKYDYLIIEYIPNSIDLEKFTRIRKCNYTVNELKVIGNSCIAILRNIHERGVIHRDLKPDNFMIVDRENKRFELYLIDYGLSAILDEGNMNVIKYPAGNLLFTKIYSFASENNYPIDDLQSIVMILYYFYNGCNTEWIEWNDKFGHKHNNFKAYNLFRKTLFERFLNNEYFVNFLLGYKSEYSDKEMDAMYKRLSPIISHNDILRISYDTINDPYMDNKTLMRKLLELYLPNQFLVKISLKLIDDLPKSHEELREIYLGLMKTDINKTIFGFMMNAVKNPPEDQEELNIFYNNLLNILQTLE